MSAPYFWLGAEAEQAVIDHDTAVQRALEAAIVIDTSDVDE